MRAKRIALWVLAGSLLTVPALRSSAKHPSNAGPEDPPIKFELPPPRPLSPQEELETFKLQDDFEIQLVAAEPLVEDPVAISFDENGRMWVVEMRGYMHDVDATGQDEPSGRIKILEDTRETGRFDRATVFADRLVMPRAATPVRGGALVGEPPTLWFARDFAQKTAVVNNYGTRGGQPEHMANSPTYGLDNWIYNADYAGRFRFQGGKWVVEADRLRGQWGLTQDDYGRLYFDYNEDLLRCDLVPAHHMLRNPNSPGRAGTNVRIMADQTVWPSHPTPGVNRGYEPQILRDDGTLRKCTANCGPCVYRGDLFPPAFHGNCFICEPAGNLVKRVILTDQGGAVTAKNAYDGVDFLTSTDERFRPVDLMTGPDGALYVVDMYRGVLEHERFITNYLLKNIKQRKLESPIHRGRIWRIVPRGTKPVPFKIPQDAAKLVECLANPAGWVRDTAQRLLVERHDWSTEPLVEKMAATGPTALARLHALWTLEGMNRMEMPMALAALNDADGHVRAAGIRLCEPYLVPATRPEVLPAMLALRDDAEPAVRLQLLLTLGAAQVAQADDALASLLASNQDILRDLARDAALSGLRGREFDFLQRLLESDTWKEPSAARSDFIGSLARCVWAEHRPAVVRQLVRLAAEQSADHAWRQAAILNGMANPLKGTGIRNPPKIIYLDRQPDGLDGMLASDDKETSDLARKIDSHLAWPDKPGVTQPPKVVPLTAEQQARFEHGKRVFTNVCAACHQATGLGQGGLAPPLVDSEWVLGPPRRTIRIVLHGLNGPVKVDGVEYTLEMPALGTLNDDEIAAVLTYVRREWDHGADPVDVADVREVRQETRQRANAWTAAELSDVK
jgi:mono/diheme cytochrome c family protein/glucose/arabinose dehydrogenase